MENAVVYRYSGWVGQVRPRRTECTEIKLRAEEIEEKRMRGRKLEIEYTSIRGLM